MIVIARSEEREPTVHIGSCPVVSVQCRCSVAKMFSHSNGKRNSRDLAAAMTSADDVENYALLAADEGGGGGQKGSAFAPDHHHLDTIELMGTPHQQQKSGE